MVTNAVRYLTPKEAQVFFASKPSTSVIRKWMRVGVHDRRVPNGKDRIVLRSISEGGNIVTTVEWIVEFQTECAKNRKDGER